jgi:hypothetical protein
VVALAEHIAGVLAQVAVRRGRHVEGSCNKSDRYFVPGANPTIVSYNATSSLVHF